MTKVQALSIPHALAGADIVAKAQTGTGKTVAFLVPAVNRAASRGASNFVSALIISPTRELAAQIHAEACQVLTFHTGLAAQVIVGGTNMTRDVKSLSKVDVLIATPGRLLDHIANTPGFVGRLNNLQTFILDEADRMLDMGFRPDLERIVSATGGPSKQTLLFSATIAPDVIELAPKLLARRFMFIDASNGRCSLTTTERGVTGVARLEVDDPFVTARQVSQEVCFIDQQHQVRCLVDILLRERQNHSHKVMVFFTTARLTQLFSELFSALGYPVLEIHSRKSQSHRQKTSDTFRDSKNVMMFSSDVTARGMDYPDVTLVLQVGLPSSAEQYVHRLGRTGRAGMNGRGLLLLMPEERFFLRQLEQLPIREIRAPAPEVTQQTIDSAMQRVPYETRNMAYAAWLGFYNSFSSKLRWNKESLVERANTFATEILRLSSPPALQAKTVGKMGLKGVPGLIIEGRNPQKFMRDESIPAGVQLPQRQQPFNFQRGAAGAPGRGGRANPHDHQTENVRGRGGHSRSRGGYGYTN